MHTGVREIHSTKFRNLPQTARNVKRELICNENETVKRKKMELLSCIEVLRKDVEKYCDQAESNNDLSYKIRRRYKMSSLYHEMTITEATYPLHLYQNYITADHMLVSLLQCHYML